MLFVEFIKAFSLEILWMIYKRWCWKRSINILISFVKVFLNVYVGVVYRYVLCEI